MENKIKKITSFTRATKIFRNIFNQKLKGLCNENDKTLIKEIMEHTKKKKEKYPMFMNY